MDKILLDNMCGQELKEMIDDEIITLEALDNTALEKILNFETDMLCFGTGDMTIIRRCSELLNERNDTDVLNKDKIISILDKAQQEHVIIVDEVKTHESKAKVIRGKHIILRRIGLVAAILTLMIVTTTLVAAAFGVNIFEYIGKAVRQEEGAEINVDEFTFHNGGETKKYSTIEEMVEEENLNIMYPTKLPEGVLVNKVMINQNERGNDLIHISTNDANIYISIEIDFNIPVVSFDDCITYNHNGMTYCIFQENTVFATCDYKNCCYYIQANDYDELIYIIDNMKE